jgi:hypothetical protein
VGASTRKIIGSGIIEGGTPHAASVGVIVESLGTDPLPHPIPDVLGLEIYPVGTHDGQPYYKTTDDVWFIFWDAVQTSWSFFTSLVDNAYTGPNWFSTDTPTPFPFDEQWAHDAGAVGYFSIIAL